MARGEKGLTQVSHRHKVERHCHAGEPGLEILLVREVVGDLK